jgi:predicted acyl esterase
VHGPANVGQQRVGELDFGPNADWDLLGHRLTWHDYWLKGIDNPALDGSPVQIFLMGANRWLGLDAWPPPGVVYQPFYLRAGAGTERAGRWHRLLSFLSSFSLILTPAPGARPARE